MSGADLRAEGGADKPDRAGLVLVTLILVAAVANLNLSVANVALPSIGEAFDSSQVTLNLIAVGYSLGLAASVLYLGALGDRYGRKMMLVLGTALAIPMSLLAAYAPSDEVLFVARVGGGLAAGMAYPTTLALITALWSGPGRTKSIALWSALGGAIAALGPLVAGALLEEFWWGSVFLVTLPLAGIALVMAFLFVPSHVNETSDPVDNLGGILSVVLVGSLILAINFAPVPNEGALVLGLALVALASLGAFFIRQRRAAESAVRLAHRGSADLLGRRLRGDHRLRLADGRHVRQPAVPTERARLLDTRGRHGDHPRGARDGRGRASFCEAHRGSRFSLHLARRLRLPAPRVPHDARRLGRRCAVLADRSRVHVRGRGSGAGRDAGVALPDGLRAGDARRNGVGHGRSPARPRRRHHAVDLRRIAHGRVCVCSIRSDRCVRPEHHATQRKLSSRNRLQGPRQWLQQHPQYADAIIAGAKEAFLEGDDWAYTAGVVAILLGAVLVFFMFPRHDEEERLLASYHAHDTGLVA